MPLTYEAIARCGYEAYRRKLKRTFERTGFDPQFLPPWRQLSEVRQQAWVAASIEIAVTLGED